MYSQTNLFSWALLKSLKKLAFIGALQAALAIGLALQIKLILSSQHIFTNGFDIKILIPFFIAVAIGGLKWYERVEAEHVGQNYVHTIRQSLFDHLSRLSFRTFARKRKGPLLLRFMNDLTALRQWVSIGLSRLLVSSIVFVSGLSALFFINRHIAIWITGLFLSGALCAFVLGRFVNASVRDARKRRSILASGITEKIMTMPSIQILARRQVERRDFLRKSKRLKAAMGARANTIGLLRGLTRLVGSLALVLTALIGATNLQSGVLTLGELFAALALISFITPALYDLGRVYEYWHGAQIAREKIDSLLRLEPIILPPIKGKRSRISGLDIRFKAVKFLPALHNIDVIAKHGEKIALFGSNGAGKSTLLHLIMRLDEVSSGHILLGGTSIKKFGIGSLRRTITLASSDDPLFKGNVSKNLCYPGAVSDLSQAKPLLNALGMDIDDPKSAFWKDRPVKEGGTNLSKGEISAIVIARALLIKPKILLLDEVDVHLDKAMKTAFFKVLSGFEGTVIAATHDPEFMTLCTKVWKLERGRISVSDTSGSEPSIHRLHSKEIN